MNDMPIFIPFTSFSVSLWLTLDQVSNIHRHFLDLSRVELLDITHHSDIIGGNKIDGDTKIQLASFKRKIRRKGTLYDQNVLRVQFCGYSFHDLQASHN